MNTRETEKEEFIPRTIEVAHMKEENALAEPVGNKFIPVLFPAGLTLEN